MAPWLINERDALIAGLLTVDLPRHHSVAIPQCRGISNPGLFSQTHHASNQVYFKRAVRKNIVNLRRYGSCF